MRKLHFKFLDYLFEDIYEVKSKEYPDSRFWKKNDNVVLELENPSLKKENCNPIDKITTKPINNPIMLCIFVIFYI